MNPTQRTLKLLREEGYTAEVVERWVPRVNIRKDLFGFIDIVAIKEHNTLAVQATSRSNISSRVHKIEDHENIGVVRKAGWQVQVWGWGKMANGRWEVRKVDVS